jgi:mannose-6-phosphate isomerase
MMVLDEGAHVKLGDEVLQPEPQEKVSISRQTTHRLSAAGDRPVRVLETSFRKYFDEEDIVRLEDAYGCT